MSPLKKTIDDLSREKALGRSPRVAQFQAEREATLQAICEASTVQELREVLLVMHRKIYS